MSELKGTQKEIAELTSLFFDTQDHSFNASDFADLVNELSRRPLTDGCHTFDELKGICIGLWKKAFVAEFMRCTCWNLEESKRMAEEVAKELNIMEECPIYCVEQELLCWSKSK